LDTFQNNFVLNGGGGGLKLLGSIPTFTSGMVVPKLVDFSKHEDLLRDITKVFFIFSIEILKFWDGVDCVPLFFEDFISSRFEKA
jgi:hypothetical protein